MFYLRWPVFFYGTHNVAWVSDRNLKRMIKEESPIPEFDPKFQFGTRFERAVFEFYASPWVGLEEWSDPEPRWEDSVKDFKKKIQSPRLMGWAKQIPPHDKFVPEHWKNHIRGTLWTIETFFKQLSKLNQRPENSPTKMKIQYKLNTKKRSSNFTIWKLGTSSEQSTQTITTIWTSS